MRLSDVERGEHFTDRVLIALISRATGMRLPDAARVAFYHKTFLGGPLGAWTQATMRGSSDWSVGERELMAALVAKWNANPFCIGAHSAVAAKALDRSSVAAALDDYRSAPVSPQLKATLAFLETMTLRPEELTSAHAESVFRAGVSRPALHDAIAVATLFNIVTRYADALAFTVPSADEFERASGMLIKRGYR